MWTKTCIAFIIAFLCVIVQYNVIYAKRILAISNFPSYSHQISYRALWLELHRRGHEIVSVTTDPINNSSLTNYTEIDLKYFYNHNFPEYKTLLPYASVTKASLKLQLLEVERRMVWAALHILNREVFKKPEMKKLYAPGSNEHFDAVIVAQGPTVSMNAFAYRFNAPLIGISSTDVFNHLRYTFGSLLLPSHISNWQTNTPVEKNMSFWRRLVNFYEVWRQMYFWANEHTVIEDAIAKEYLGQDLPHIDDITRNMSIYLVNKHPTFLHGKPEQPNVIFYHGFHIAKAPDTLPENVKQFLDDAKEGFIYVSLGTNVRWEDLPNNALEAFVEAFSALPYKFIWKFNPDLLPKKFKNILALNWLPQQSILAHPNIKLFIYQGGQQSTEEAIYYGIPLIGFPIIWDQIYQVQNIVRLGVGIQLQIDNLSNKSIMASIHEVISNKRYKNQMEHLSKLFKDSPYDSLQNAVQWIEYVIRLNGTPFLRNSLGDEPWYQRYDWDIIGFLAIVLFIASLISIWALLQIFRFHLRLLSNSLW
ncbi:UDP-glycosyltransferase UGT5-like [Temnothorax longispinosus]|uniref:UDP-glycosyltransferase UGT5-like n=1 Tax=Temnothorax longispinosus TaxID=300112 RepID=UPI003A998BE7